MTELSNKVVADYVRRYPGAGTAAYEEHGHGQVIRLLKSLLALTDMQLEDEGFDVDVRRRVLAAALYDVDVDRARQLLIAYTEAEKARGRGARSKDRPST